jgi:hypothetical protein
MSKLDDILYSINLDPDVRDENKDLGLLSPEEAKERIKTLISDFTYEVFENKLTYLEVQKRIDTL